MTKKQVNGFLSYLLTNIITRRGKKLHKNWNSPVINDNLSVLWSSWCNVCESPCCLKLHITSHFSIKESFICRDTINDDEKTTMHQKKTCSCGKSSLWRNSTKRGTTPACITSSIGGLLSTEVNRLPTGYNDSSFINTCQDTTRVKFIIWIPIESNFRNCVVASSCIWLSSEQTPATIFGRDSSCKDRSHQLKHRNWDIEEIILRATRYWANRYCSIPMHRPILSSSMNYR